MKTSLSLCMTENRDILGSKYENLGKRVSGISNRSQSDGLL